MDELITKHSDTLLTMKSTLDEKVNLSDMKNYVTRKHYEEAVTALGSEIDSKTPSLNYQESVKRLTELEELVAEEQKKLMVAMRFVEWFVERGTSYEQNIKVLDKHIENLAKANLPASRQPYSGQVRYTAVMNPTFNQEVLQKVKLEQPSGKDNK
jgi:hypothetical protein